MINPYDPYERRVHSSSHKRHRSALWGLNGVAKNTPLAWTRTPPARVHRTSSDGGAKILGPPAAYLNTLHELPSTSDNFRPASSARLGPAALKIYWHGRYKKWRSGGGHERSTAVHNYQSMMKHGWRFVQGWTRAALLGLACNIALVWAPV